MSDRREQAGNGAPHILSETTSLLEALPIRTQAYFQRLVDGSMSREGFVASQKQFFYAVQFFSRPIAALVARCPDSAMRMDLVHNLAEEQGDFHPSEAHDRTFLMFLSSLGVTKDAMAEEKELPGVGAFNAALLGACMGGERDAAFGCLGMIEYAFADLSAIIGRVVVERGWVDEERLVHYTLHAEIDKRHAEEFFAVVEPRWVSTGGAQGPIGQGLALGRHVFARLYDDLHDVALRHE